MQAVVIAAGESKRFWPLNNGIHKSQFKLLGKSLIYWTLKGLAENNIKNVVVVVAKDSSVQEELGEGSDLGLSITYVVQKEPLGTGNALWQAKDLVKESFILLWGNKVGSKELVSEMIGRQKEEGADAVLVGTEVENPSDYGVFRLEAGPSTGSGQGKIVEIIENPEQGKEPSRIALAGAYLLGPDLFEYYEKLSKHHEADLVDAINAYVKDKKVSLLVIEQKGLTLKYPWDLFGIMDYLFTSDYFKSLVAKSAQVPKNVIIRDPEHVYIGENTVIKDGTIIEGSSYIGDNCVVGYSNVLRGFVDLEAGVKTGAFMEIKNSIVQKGTIFHSGYLGDSMVGKNCTFGAGFVTGNLRFDKKPIHGLPKLGAMVGDNSMFGIHSGTMPGVMIGTHCKIGPATHVFENLQDNTALYAKFDHVKK